MQLFSAFYKLKVVPWSGHKIWGYFLGHFYNLETAQDQSGYSYDYL